MTFAGLMRETVSELTACLGHVLQQDVVMRMHMHHNPTLQHAVYIINALHPLSFTVYTDFSQPCLQHFNSMYAGSYVMKDNQIGCVSPLACIR